MRKLVLIAAVVASLAGSAVVSGLAATDSPDAGRMERMSENRALMLDARIAGMKAALNLTPDQEKVWAPFEAAVRDVAKAHMEAMRARREAMGHTEGATPIDRMNQISDRLAGASTALKKVADAAKPLFDSLDETQKRHFGPLLMSLRGRGEGVENHMGGEAN